MRLLVVANLPPYVMGGAENQVARLVDAWMEDGLDVEVAGHRIPSGIHQVHFRKLKLHRIRVVNRFGRLVRALSYFFSLGILLLQHQKRFDAIYCRGLGDGALTLCALKALGLLRLPLLVCLINAKGAGDVAFMRSIPGWRFWVGLIDRHCEAINLIAPAMQDDLHSVGISSPRISHIPNGISIQPELTPSMATRTQKTFVFVGRLSHQKGLDNLLSAMKHVFALGRKFQLLVVGEGPERSALHHMANDVALASWVTFVGAVDALSIRRILSDADVFVLPSRYEGMSNAALEAMEAGLPLLITRCGGIDTYLDEQSAWLCDTDDERQLVDAIIAAVDSSDDVCRMKGQRCRQLVLDKFGIDAVARRNLAILASLADGSVKVK